MVQTMVAIYDALDRKNADKVYNILAKESIQCFNIELERVSPPLSPAQSVDRTNSQPTKSKKGSNSGLTNKDIQKQRQVPRAQNYIPPKIKSHQNVRK